MPSQLNTPTPDPIADSWSIKTILKGKGHVKNFRVGIQFLSGLRVEVNNHFEPKSALAMEKCTLPVKLSKILFRRTVNSTLHFWRQNNALKSVCVGLGPAKHDCNASSVCMASPSRLRVVLCPADCSSSSVLTFSTT